MVEKLRNHSEVFLDDASFSPIMRGDVFDQVMQLGRFAEVDLVVRRDAITEIEQAEETNQLGRAFRIQAEYAPEMAKVGIYLRRESGARGTGGGQDLKAKVVAVVRRFLPLFSVARVKVEQNINGRINLIDKDFLQDKLIHKVSVVEERNGVIRSSDMFDKIDAAYQANLRVLRRVGNE